MDTTTLIKTLATILSEHGLNELEIEQDGLKVRLAKQGGGYQVPTTLPAFVPPHTIPLTNNISNNAFVETQQQTKHISTINAKMVGVFYAASSPDAKPFAQVGDKISKGDVLYIIEAMKTMNEIVAEFDCEITKVLVSNGELIQYGQSLFEYKLL
ncbi:MAG: acetyl-CoA carboxylase biotin carboxyl carrier protein [Firmicutes bacterium]|nr:acetyl-CoA carboxylase biotin carboxyl carrier protein [Bacillota bacterium]MCL1953240.1 acetyl-CoA carboxylase biotin carboxyl carrier protein [Bacillota bacterium]